MSIETWWDDDYKYEVELTDRILNKDKTGKVDTFVLIYTVVNQTERIKK